MTKEELQEFRKNLVKGNNHRLQELYLAHKDDVANFLVVKNYCERDIAEGHFSEALLILRNNVISDKVKELSNPKSYIISVCINLVRNENYKEKRKKEQQVRLLLHEEKYNVSDKWDVKEERIKICKDALLTLSEKCQIILTNFYVHKLRMKDIAEQLGLSSSDVAKTLKSRCYKSWMEAVKTRMS